VVRATASDRGGLSATERICSASVTRARVGALRSLVDHGTLERRPYDRRPRYEYILTDKGAELVDLLMVVVAWDDKWLAGKPRPPVLYRHHACGQISHVDLRCAHCREPMHAGDLEVLPGPGAAA
jgi:HxlR-like helix-turn-helix